MENFKIEVDGDGVALVTFDAPARSMNTLTAAVQDDLAQVVDRLATDPQIKGAVITSGKASGFCAGGDLEELLSYAGAGADAPVALREAAYERQMMLNATLRRLETCGKPLATAINGLALGGGLELALATHRRFVSDHPKMQLGLPEAKVGLMPGAGGTQRLPRLIGAEKALSLMLDGRAVSGAEALKLGFIDAVLPTGELIAAARAWVLATPDAKQPWDQPGYELPHGGPYGAGALAFINAPAAAARRWYGNYPGRSNIVRAVYEGVQTPIDSGLRIEARYFVATLLSPEAAAMIRSTFQSVQELNRGFARPKDAPPSEIGKVSVLGAGMMGAGIAYVQARAGIDTVLLDASADAAAKGKEYARTILARQVSKAALTQEDADAILARIKATDDYADVTGSDLVIEAVFEDREVKAKVIAQTEAHLAPGAIFASNTSTLPITGLAQASRDPATFIGLHFFSPVDRMDLVEIILGEETADATLAVAIDYVRRIRKTPIVVRDSRGFYTSRCFDTYIREGMEMLAEGIAPEIIDNVGRATGMPRGPLELTDDVAIDLVDRIAKQAQRDLGEAFQRRTSDDVVDRMVALGRHGRKNGKGFYDYGSDGAKESWSGLKDEFPVRTERSSPELIASIRTRLLYRQAVEAARCMDEGVVGDPRYADVGALLGWSFASWTGGPLSLIDSVGVAKFVETCDALAKAHGDRFTPPTLLKQMAESGEAFYPRAP